MAKSVKIPVAKAATFLEACYAAAELSAKQARHYFYVYRVTGGYEVYDNFRPGRKVMAEFHAGKEV